MTEILLGARLAIAGGRDGLIRTVMTAAGIGIGVAMLLLAAAVPGALSHRAQRLEARVPGAATDRPAANSTLMVDARTTYRDHPVHGALLRPESPEAPMPPGVTRFPAVGEAVVSPALRNLLGSADGALLRERLPYRITGTIGPAGLAGPAELTYYAGAPAADPGDDVRWVTTFGTTVVGAGFDAVLGLLTTVIFVVLLLPVGVFAAGAVRFGGEERDRRLAALRLVGADKAMVRRIATGETLAAAVAGLLAGGAFFLLGREIATRFSLADISVYAGDISPGLIPVSLVVLLVPALAVAVTLLALRGVVIEPLGVFRRARPTRGGRWWRLLLPATGLVVLAPMLGQADSRRSAPYGAAQSATGLVLLLTGVVALLPWLVEAAVSRLRGGPVPWQLAIRRLQLQTGGGPMRVVNGIAAAVAGAIALQMLFTGIEPGYRNSTGADPGRASGMVQTPVSNGFGLLRTLGTTPGVDHLVAVREHDAHDAGLQTRIPVQIADCATLRLLAALPSCADGDVFRTAPAAEGPVTVPPPGARLIFGNTDRPWSVPAAALLVVAAINGDGSPFTGLLATPRAMPPTLLDAGLLTVYLHVARSDPDAIERVRTVVERSGTGTHLADVTAFRTTSQFADMRRGLLIGTVVTLLLIGFSLLVGTLEQLRDRRRLLAVLAALGTRRGTLGWSMLWQTAVPVMLGLLLAVPSGIAVGALLLRVVDVPVHVRVAAVAGTAGIAAAVVLLVTAASLPALWRSTRPDGLRTE
jgi:FtsX-like permease family protein